MSSGRDDERHAKRERVLDAAEGLLRDGGPDALSMRTLARRAEVGHVTPYHLFDSKHGVVLALLVRVVAPHLPSITSPDPGADPLDDLLARQHRLMDLLGTDEAFARAALLALDESAAPAERSRWLDFVAARIDEDLRRLVDAGLVRGDAPLELTARTLLVGRDGAVRRWFRGLSSLEELRRDDLAVVLHAVLAVATDEGRPRLWSELAAHRGAGAAARRTPPQDDLAGGLSR